MTNSVYAVTGASGHLGRLAVQDLLARGVPSSDIVAIAQGCGIANSAWAADEEDFERLVDQSLIATVPMLIALRIDDKPGVSTTDRDPVQIRERFMRGVGVRKEVKTG